MLVVAVPTRLLPANTSTSTASTGAPWDSEVTHTWTSFGPTLSVPPRSVTIIRPRYSRTSPSQSTTLGAWNRVTTQPRPPLSSAPMSVSPRRVRFGSTGPGPVRRCPFFWSAARAASSQSSGRARSPGWNGATSIATSVALRCL